MTTIQKPKGRKRVPAARACREPTLPEQANRLVMGIVHGYHERERACQQARVRRGEALEALAECWRKDRAARWRSENGLPADAALSVAGWQAVFDVPSEGDLLDWGKANGAPVVVPPVPAKPVLTEEEMGLLRYCESGHFAPAVVMAARGLLSRLGLWQRPAMTPASAPAPNAAFPARRVTGWPWN